MQCRWSARAVGPLTDRLRGGWSASSSRGGRFCAGPGPGYAGCSVGRSGTGRHGPDRHRSCSAAAALPEGRSVSAAACGDRRGVSRAHVHRAASQLRGRGHRARQGLAPPLPCWTGTRHSKRPLDIARYRTLYCIYIVQSVHEHMGLMIDMV